MPVSYRLVLDERMDIKSRRYRDSAAELKIWYMYWLHYVRWSHITRNDWFNVLFYDVTPSSAVLKPLTLVTLVLSKLKIFQENFIAGWFECSQNRIQRKTLMERSFEALWRYRAEFSELGSQLDADVKHEGLIPFLTLPFSLQCSGKNKLQVNRSVKCISLCRHCKC